MQQVYTNVATDAKLFVRDLCDNFTVQRGIKKKENRKIKENQKE
jgi:hypothetical protein